MKNITVRLKEGQFFREEIERVVREREIRAGVILSAVGGIKNANLRVPKFDTGEHVVKQMDGPFELVSCMGTLSADGCHIHVSVSDREGKCYGGHLKEGCAVFCTIEVVIGVIEDAIYHRKMDSETGFEELVADEVA
jgi:predicted DNA-binding protein with PD1-like motif